MGRLFKTVGLTLTGVAIGGVIGAAVGALIRTLMTGSVVNGAILGGVSGAITGAVSINTQSLGLGALGMISGAIAAAATDGLYVSDDPSSTSVVGASAASAWFVIYQIMRRRGLSRPAP